MSASSVMVVGPSPDHPLLAKRAPQQADLAAVVALVKLVEGEPLHLRVAESLGQPARRILRGGQLLVGFRVEGTHQAEWVQAIVEGRQACSHWDYASGLTEVGLLGNVAIRANTRIEYDARKMRITNYPEANRFLKKEYPKGWILS